MADDMTVQCHSISNRVYARVGLLGAPSDMYNGAVISASLENYFAEVTLNPLSVLKFHAAEDDGATEYPSLEAFEAHIEQNGYSGSITLLQAVVRRVIIHCRAADTWADHDGTQKLPLFSLSYTTNIPRQRGLSGSSALACAALNSIIGYWELESLIPYHDRPQLLLEAERDLGITGGLQDRIVQVYGGVIFMDFNTSGLNSKNNSSVFYPGRVRSIEVGQLLTEERYLYVIHPGSDVPSEKTSGGVHERFRKKWERGDETHRGMMKEIADLARHASTNPSYWDDPQQLAEALRRNFQLRRNMFGDEAIGSDTIAMANAANSVGAAANQTGSGGAVLAFCPRGPEQSKKLMHVCHTEGFVCERVRIRPRNVDASL